MSEKRKWRSFWWLVAGVLAMASPPVRGAELVALSPSTWDRYVPRGKEVDAILGDFVLANDELVAVVANPKRGRNANMTVRDVGGCLIDLTRRERQSDQLSAFYPGGQRRELRFAGIEVEAPETYDASELERVFVRGRRVGLRLVATPREKEPDVEVVYRLTDGSPFVEIATTFTNRGPAPIEVSLLDAIRADRTFEHSPSGPAAMFWAYDKHFGQAYGIVAEGHQIASGNARQLMLMYRDGSGKVAQQLAPGRSYRLVRHVIPGANLFDLERLAGKNDRTIALSVKDEAGGAIADADVTLSIASHPRAWGRTDHAGRLTLAEPAESGMLTVEALGHGSKGVAVEPNGPRSLAVVLPEAGVVAARITDERGEATPCKVQFTGRGSTRSPNFGPDTGEHAVRNVYYSHDGRFRRKLEPGAYDVIVSYGPEHDAVFMKIDVTRGKETSLEAKLVRSVKSDGWISTDFHSHSSPSGDNTSSQLGRVLNLLCEQVEFAPCTEHNRLSTYDPHLERLKAVSKMGTCVGIELTGSPLPLNHQNAFPMILHPNVQDGGGPTSDADPAIQIERLKLWDGGSEKLVQVNHPDVGWMFHDRDGNGEPDSGFAGMAANMDVVEVHPLSTIFDKPVKTTRGRTENNRVVNWLQLLNQGKRIPGVVNTDAHYNFHGSGFLRNFVKSPTDDPAAVRALDVVHECERGHIVMSSGPFLEVKLRREGDGSSDAIPGDSFEVRGGSARLRVRVQCPNWFDVDRVQVLLNGKADESLNFTRSSNSDRFLSTTLKFDQEIPLHLERDTHVIVVAIGERATLGPVMGPEHAGDRPVAVSNPIYVDVDGGGFKPSGDTLGTLPVKAGL